MKKKKTEEFLFKQARKLRSYASPKLLLAHSLTGVNCRATSIAKKGKVSFSRNLTLQCNLSEKLNREDFVAKGKVMFPKESHVAMHLSVRRCRQSLYALRHKRNVHKLFKRTLNSFLSYLLKVI